MDDTRCFAAPGRVEIGGNHTDHQRGRVLATAIDMETAVAVKVNCLNVVRLSSVGFGTLEVDLSDLSVRNGEKGTSAALIRGVAAWFRGNGYHIGGFDAEILSTVPIGEGLSSSAAFEVMIGNAFKGLFGADISPVEIALAGQYAENEFFGKPCGLMDQAASSFGGLNVIDFMDSQNPVITPVNAEIPGYHLCVVATGSSHADLTPEYAACTYEMRTVAAYFGKEHLSEVDADEFFSSIGRMRQLGDRAILRAIHFFGENERVLKQADALKRCDIKEFLRLVAESGRSSLTYLQNVYDPANPQQQGLTLALALSEKTLGGKGAWRVHGGGFAGTILAFVPYALKNDYNLAMSAVFGENCCRFLGVREEGGGEKVFSRCASQNWQQGL